MKPTMSHWTKNGQFRQDVFALYEIVFRIILLSLKMFNTRKNNINLIRKKTINPKEHISEDKIY